MKNQGKRTTPISIPPSTNQPLPTAGSKTTVPAAAYPGSTRRPVWEMPPPDPPGPSSSRSGGFAGPRREEAVQPQVPEVQEGAHAAAHREHAGWGHRESGAPSWLPPGPQRDDTSRSPERRALNRCPGRARTSQACRAPSPAAMSVPQPSVLVTSSARPRNSGRPAASTLRAQRQPPEAIAALTTEPPPPPLKPPRLARRPRPLRAPITRFDADPAAQSDAVPQNRPARHGPIRSRNYRLSAALTSRQQASRRVTAGNTEVLRSAQPTSGRPLANGSVPGPNRPIVCPAPPAGQGREWTSKPPGAGRAVVELDLGVTSAVPGTPRS